MRWALRLACDCAESDSGAAFVGGTIFLPSIYSTIMRFNTGFMLTVQRLVPVVSALLLALAGWLSALLCWDLVSLAVDEQTANPAQALLNSRVTQPSRPSYDLAALMAVPLFGEAAKAAANAPLSAEVVKRTNLRINLLGVVVGGDGGVAILKHDGKEYAYKVGDKLDVREDITLVTVASDYAIIARAGGNEKIELDRPALAGLRDNEIKVMSRPGMSSTIVNLNDPSIRRLIGDPKQTLNTNPLRLTRYISAEPRVEGGKTIGFSVQPGRDKRLFGQLGLQPGDVVVSINSQRVGEAAVSDLLNSVNNSQSVEVEILRNGLQQTIRLNL
ncbi:MAG: general secretion pathway protein C [Bacteroidia bacterium]